MKVSKQQQKRFRTLILDCCFAIVFLHDIIGDLKFFLISCHVFPEIMKRLPLEEVIEEVTLLRLLVLQQTVLVITVDSVRCLPKFGAAIVRFT